LLTPLFPPLILLAEKQKRAPRRGGGEQETVQGLRMNDQATAVAADVACKKLFIGTAQGAVLLVEAASLGFLADIATDTELSDEGRASRGAVVSLHYDDPAELLTVIFCSGYGLLQHNCPSRK
jgi:hypothetical protein